MLYQLSYPSSVRIILVFAHFSMHRPVSGQAKKQAYNRTYEDQQHNGHLEQFLLFLLRNESALGDGFCVVNTRSASWGGFSFQEDSSFEEEEMGYYFQSYGPSAYGPDTGGTIAGRIKALLDEGHGPDVVVAKLQAEKYDVKKESHGYILVTNGHESCSYPLERTAAKL